MPSERTKYEVELLCDYPGWWRFNVYIMVAGYDRSGNRISFNSITDRIYDLEYAQGRQAPRDYDTGRIVKLITDPCDYADIYVYAVANTFPDSEQIKDSPPFPAVLRVSAAGRLLSENEYEVNQWGGLTIVALRADQDKI